MFVDYSVLYGAEPGRLSLQGSRDHRIPSIFSLLSLGLLNLGTEGLVSFAKLETTDRPN